MHRNVWPKPKLVWSGPGPSGREPWLRTKPSTSASGPGLAASGRRKAAPKVGPKPIGSRPGASLPWKTPGTRCASRAKPLLRSLSRSSRAWANSRRLRIKERSRRTHAPGPSLRLGRWGGCGRGSERFSLALSLFLKSWFRHPPSRWNCRGPVNPVNYRTRTEARCKQQEKSRGPVKVEIYRQRPSSI